jgi:hypothetical protein
MTLAQLNATGRAPLMAPGIRLPTTRVAKRYDVVPRTVERWAENPALNFPKPLIVNGRKYWLLEELEAWERNRAATAEVAE